MTKIFFVWASIKTKINKKWLVYQVFLWNFSVKCTKIKTRDKFCILFSVYLIQFVNDRFRIFNYPKLFVIRVKIWLFMETLNLLKNQFKGYNQFRGSRWQSLSFCFFLDASHPPVKVCCIFGSKYIMGSV